MTVKADLPAPIPRWCNNCELDRLTILLKRIIIGDRILETVIELFDYGPQDISTNEAQNRSMSSEQRISYKMCVVEDAVRGLKSNEISIDATLDLIISALNHAFPDYDFGVATDGKAKTHIRREANLVVFQNKINHSLLFYIEQAVPGFAELFWETVKSAICLDMVDVYSYDAAGDSGFPVSENCLSSDVYFIIDHNEHQILLISWLITANTVGAAIGLSKKQMARQHADDFGNATEEDNLGLLASLVDCKEKPDAGWSDTERSQSSEPVAAAVSF